jgi:large subunit ribosomal protein L18
MKIQDLRKKRRQRRKMHIRKNIYGTETCPRMTVFKSNKHIYAQLIDDVNGKTLIASSTLDSEVKSNLKPDMNKRQESALVGESIAKKAQQKNLSEIVFDRNGYRYHGRVKSLADSARKAGLKF